MALELEVNWKSVWDIGHFIWKLDWAKWHQSKLHMRDYCHVNKLLPRADRIGEYVCSTAAISKILEVTSLPFIMQIKMEGQVNRRVALIHDKPLSRITERTKMLSQTSFSILCILKC